MPTKPRSERGGGRRALAIMVAVAACALGPAPDHAGAVSAERPSFLHVMTDDQTVESIRHMPQLRRLVSREGTLFENNHVVTPLCCPSRATFLTGQYTHNHGLIHNAPPEGFVGMDFSRTLYTAMQDAGYRTGWIGKVLNAPGPVAIEPPAGFDEWFVPIDESQHDMFDYRVSDNGTEIRIEGAHQNPLYRERALRFVRDPDPAPFLLTLSYFTPHWVVCPDFVPGERARRCPPEPAPVDRGSFADARYPFGPDWEGDREQRAETNRWWRHELESLRSVDRGIGALVRELERTGRLENTYVIFQSDNGFHHGEQGIFWLKNSPWESSVRVPMAIRGPGFEPAREGRPERRRDLTANVDVPATILDAAAVEPPLPLDGHSLLGPHRRRMLLIERLQRPRFTQVKTAGGWTYWRGQGPWRGGHLYDLGDDPDQLTNLAGAEPAKARRLLRRLRAARGCAATCP